MQIQTFIKSLIMFMMHALMPFHGFINDKIKEL